MVTGPLPLLVLLLVAADDHAPAGPAGPRKSSPVVEVPPLTAPPGEADFPRGLFWARGDSLVPLVCLPARGAAWVVGAACRKVLPAPFRGRSSTATVKGQRWTSRAIHQVGRGETMVVQARDALGVGVDQQQEVSPEECLVLVPGSAPSGLRVFPLAAAAASQLEWDLGPQKLHLDPGPYRGKQHRERGAQEDNQVVTADGQHRWDGSNGAEAVTIVGAVDLAGTGAPLTVVHQHLADVGGDRVTVLDPDLQPLASFHWSLYAD
jgi:hypothetical protein